MHCYRARLAAVSRAQNRMLLSIHPDAMQRCGIEAQRTTKAHLGVNSGNNGESVMHAGSGFSGHGRIRRCLISGQKLNPHQSTIASILDGVFGEFFPAPFHAWLPVSQSTVVDRLAPMFV